MSSMTHVNLPRITPSDDGKPERSRNAKAQARHREKRKLYIEQVSELISPLESTVTKLQTALGYTPDQVAALPPPLVKIRELEQENARLHGENEEMRRILNDDPQNRGRIPPDFGRRTTFHDGRDCDERDYNNKKRKLVDPAYMNQNDHRSVEPRPPPLTIPQPLSHHHNYTNGSQQSSVNNSATSLFNLQGPAFQMPHTPSGSSSTSSPPFSPVTMHAPSHSRPSSVPTTAHTQSSLAHYSQPGTYGSVKAEDSHYGGSHHNAHHHGHSSQYPPPTLPPFQSQETDWHAYSAERAQGQHHR